MAAYYRIDLEHRLVLTTATGVLTSEDIWGHMEKLSKDPDFNPDFSQLIDFRHVSKFEIEPQNVREFAERKLFSPQARRALLVKDDEQFGLARMFQIHRELNGEHGIQVCRSLDEALEWVLAKKAAL